MKDRYERLIALILMNYKCDTIQKNNITAMSFALGIPYSTVANMIKNLKQQGVIEFSNFVAIPMFDRNGHMVKHKRGHRKVKGTNIKDGTEVFFDSITDAAYYVEGNIHSIYSCCKNRHGFKSSKGYYWEYNDE